MESTDSSTGSQQPNLPPGFRFHPTDEELVVHYLKKKVSSAPLPVAIIAEVDLYKFDPWELPGKATFGEQEWYFFSPRDRKYPNGARPNRAATSGYWKATGTDKPVVTAKGGQKVGVKKALVFYGGKPPRGIKTNWIMHEYRLADNKPNHNKPPPGCEFPNKKNSLRLDDWVLCRIYKKSNNTQRSGMEQERDNHECMEDLIGVGKGYQHHFSKISSPSTISYGGGALMVDNSNIHNMRLISSDMDPPNSQHHHHHHHHHAFLNNPNAKRTLSSLYNWNTTATDNDVTAGTIHHHQQQEDTSLQEDQQDEASGGSLGGLNDNNVNNANSSIASLLNQIPQIPTAASSLHHQQHTMLASYPYPIPGINWYA